MCVFCLRLVTIIFNHVVELLHTEILLQTIHIATSTYEYLLVFFYQEEKKRLNLLVTRGYPSVTDVTALSTQAANQTACACMAVHAHVWQCTVAIDNCVVVVSMVATGATCSVNSTIDVGISV